MNISETNLAPAPAPATMRCHRWLLLALVLSRLLAPVSTSAVVVGPSGSVIGPETLVPLPPEAPWAGVVNVRPGNNSTVSINPPLFTWLYSPGSPTNIVNETNLYLFLFQADYDGSFANPVVNVATYSDCYNYLAPFTNNSVFWRVGYVTTNSSGAKTNAWVTNTFSIAPGATTWDRSMLADPNYLSARSGHPHLLFTASNHAALSQFIQSNDPFSWNQNLALGSTLLAQTWAGLLKAAGVQAADVGLNTNTFDVTQPWLTTPVPWVTNWTTKFYSLNDSQASQIQSLAFLWMVTGNPLYTNSLVTNYDNLVQYYIGAKLWQMDYGNGYDPTFTRSLCFCYDWLYPLLSAQEQSNALFAITSLSRSYVYNWWWSQPTNQSISYIRGNFDPTAKYPGPYCVPWSQISKRAFTHGFWGHMANWIAGFAAYGDSPDAATYMDLSLNYLIGRGTPYGIEAGQNLGRTYGPDPIFGISGDGILDEAELFQIAFPESQLNLSPYWSQNADWFERMYPPGYTEPHEQWGDNNTYRPYGFYSKSTWRDLASFSGNGKAAMAGLSETTLDGFDRGADKLDELAKPFFFQSPPMQTDTNLGQVYPADGWVFGNAVAPNSTSAFLNSVGFVFAARPCGGMWGHEAANDLNFEIWAYGANVTDAPGGDSWGSKASWGYNTIAVNGLGMSGTQQAPQTAVQAQILAFTNASDYIYCAGDATQAYPHFKFPPAEPKGWLVPPTYAGLLLSNGPQSYIQKVQRHVLFVHHQYFVIYDDLAASQPVTFSWVYHVWQDTVTNLTSGGSFQYTAPRVLSVHGVNTANYSQNYLSVLVEQVVNPTLVNATNMYATNAVSNPITGENYYPTYITDGNNGKCGLMTNSIWLSNVVPTNQFHFMTVIYPVPPGGALPQITPLDDYTVAVTNGVQGDVISFNPQTQYATTFRVASPYITVGNVSARLQAPTDFHIVQQ